MMRGGDSTTGGNPDGSALLSKSLSNFRRWLKTEANCSIHPSLCIVNGEATDGTKNAPVLLYGPPSSSSSGTPNAGGALGDKTNGSGDLADDGSPDNKNNSGGKCGTIDRMEDQRLWDCSMGCQVRCVREIKKDEVLMEIPQSSMICPTIVAESDAGRAVFGCIEGIAVGNINNTASTVDPLEYWESLVGTASLFHQQMSRLKAQSGTQLLIYILRERKRAEDALIKARKHLQRNTSSGDNSSNDGSSSSSSSFEYAKSGEISSRAPLMVFLLQQRFGGADAPVKTEEKNVARLPKAPPSPTSSSSQAATPSPSSFAPWVKTLPSSFSLPLCWQRNELALLSSCFGGVPLLQEVAAQTHILSNDLILLLKGGLLHMIAGSGETNSSSSNDSSNQHSLFPPEMLTWDSWVWAAAAQMSRAFPVDCYLREHQTLSNLLQELSLPLSPLNRAVWDDLGVLIPFMDMLNHEPTSCQIRWERAPNTSTGSNSEMNDDDMDDDHAVAALPRLVSQRRIKKGAQIFTDYGSNKSNHDLITQYGFAQVNNPADSINIAWGLSEGVGNFDKDPTGYEWIYSSNEEDDTGTNDKTKQSTTTISQKDRIFESDDATQTNNWWTEDRLKLLQLVTGVSDDFIQKLSSGKKLSATACIESAHHPVLLSSAVVCTMSNDELTRCTEERLSNSGGGGKNKRDGAASSSDDDVLPLTKRHQRSFLKYLFYFYNRKMEKLLSNLNEGLIKAHYPNFVLWQSGSKGGLFYIDDGSNSSNLGGGNDIGSGSASTNHHPAIGWQRFFETHAYTGTMEVEKHYYSMAPTSSVLVLYDGNLRAIQARLDDLVKSTSSTEGTVVGNLKEELQNLSFKLLDTEELPPLPPRLRESSNGQHSKTPTTAVGTKQEEQGSKGEGEKSGTSSRNNKRNRQKTSSSNNRSESTSSKQQRQQVDNTVDSAISMDKDGDQSGQGNNKGGNNNNNKNNNKSNNSNNNGRPHATPAIKLHIGNLSYSTRPEDLFHFFSNVLGYGPTNVLECHIPTERDTGKSRGFGFVTMPEEVALQALKHANDMVDNGEAERKLELHGRVIKLAKSNTTGGSGGGSNNRGGGSQSNRSGRGGSSSNQQRGSSASNHQNLPSNSNSNRCTNCGYRPKYCTCPGNNKAQQVAPGPGRVIPPPPPPPGPPPGPPQAGGPGGVGMMQPPSFHHHPLHNGVGGVGLAPSVDDVVGGMPPHPQMPFGGGLQPPGVPPRGPIPAALGGVSHQFGGGGANMSRGGIIGGPPPPDTFRPGHGHHGLGGPPWPPGGPVSGRGSANALPPTRDFDLGMGMGGGGRGIDRERERDRHTSRGSFHHHHHRSRSRSSSRGGGRDLSHSNSRRRGVRSRSHDSRDRDRDRDRSSHHHHHRDRNSRSSNKRRRAASHDSFSSVSDDDDDDSGAYHRHRSKHRSTSRRGSRSSDDHYHHRGDRERDRERSSRRHHSSSKQSAASLSSTSNSDEGGRGGRRRKSHTGRRSSASHRSRRERQQMMESSSGDEASNNNDHYNDDPHGRGGGAGANAAAATGNASDGSGGGGGGGGSATGGTTSKQQRRNYRRRKRRGGAGRGRSSKQQQQQQHPQSSQSPVPSDSRSPSGGGGVAHHHGVDHHHHHNASSGPSRKGSGSNNADAGVGGPGAAPGGRTSSSQALQDGSGGAERDRGSGHRSNRGGENKRSFRGERHR